MKLTLRMLVGYFLITGLTAWFVLNIFMQEVKPSVRESLEDTMVDVAYLLADMAAPELARGNFQNGNFSQAVERYRQRTVDVKIWGLQKERLELGVYVTDAQGKVLFSSNPQEIGRDYSRWNDVLKTLRGQYGARSTRSYEDDDGSAVLYVAAPVMQGDQMLGVVTVAKSVRSMEPIIARAQKKIARHGMVLLAFSLLLGILFTAWITWRINRLRRYAQAVARGERVALPDVGHSEIADLAQALESMRTKLEGKAYVERYVEALTHELKSPLTAIKASAECLQGAASEVLTAEEAEAARRQFACAIIEQADRLRQTIDTQLTLAHLERQSALGQAVPVDLMEVTRRAMESCQALAAQRNIEISGVQEPAAVTVMGDGALLTQAIASLLSNAVEFSVAGSKVELLCNPNHDHVELLIRDHGSGIPDFALQRIFERFYSLPRPDGGPKSTGLGLSLAREIVTLHHGTLAVANHPAGGVEVRVRLPVES